MKLISALVFSAVAQAATIADLLKQNPDMSQVAATIDAHPEWSDASRSLTIIAPTNAAITASKDLPPGDLGVFALNNRALDYIGVHYEVLTQEDKKKVIVWDNYEPGKPGNPTRYVAGATADPVVHVRYGKGDGTLAALLKADNGWLYISNNALAPLAPPSTTFDYLGCSMFYKAIVAAGLKDIVDGLSTLTVFAPNDAAFQESQDYLSKLTPTQVKAVLLYHMIPRVVYSSLMTTGDLPTLLAGNVMPIQSSASGADVGTGPKTGRFNLADNSITNGVIHRIAFVIQPPNLPAASAAVEPANVPAGSVSTPIASTTAAASTSAAAQPTSTESSSGSQIVQDVALAVGGILGALAL